MLIGYVNKLMNMCLIMQILFWEIIAYFREKYMIQHDFSNLNKAIKQTEQVYVMIGEKKLLIDRVWSLILVKSK